MLLPRFELTASRRLAGLLLLLHAGAIAIIFMLDIVWPIKLLLIILLSGYASWTVAKHALRTLPTSIIQCWLAETGDWHLQTKAGRIYSGQLQGDSLITPYLTVLNFKVVNSRKKLAITITSDAIDIQAFRRLRVYLATHYEQPTRTSPHQQS